MTIASSPVTSATYASRLAARPMLSDGYLEEQPLVVRIGRNFIAR